MYKSKKLFLGLLVALSLTRSNYAIQPVTAKLISLASGAGIGALIYYQPERNAIAATIGGVCTAGIMYLITREFTPARKFERAKNLLSTAENALFVYDTHTPDHIFFDAMHTAYATYDLPYAVAYYDLTKRLSLLNEAYNLFDDVCAEGELSLSCLTKEYQNRTSGLIRIVVDAIKRIKQAKEFTKQVEIYEKRRLEEQRLALEQRKVFAQASQAYAQHRQADAQHRQANAMGAR